MAGSSRTRTALIVLIVADLILLVAFCSFVFMRGYYRSKVGHLLNVRNLGIRDQFIQSYWESDVWNHTTFLGIQSQQAPTDQWNMQELFYEVKPDVVIETGTFRGGTALYYASMLSLMGDGRVITMDIEPHIEDASKFKIFQDRVEALTGSSVAPEIVDHIAKEVEGKRVLVTLDSLHTRDHVLKEMETYAKMVSVGSYMVVQDTVGSGHPVITETNPGPMEAVEEFLKTHSEFVQDRGREKFLLTFYPGGYLKRVH